MKCGEREEWGTLIVGNMKSGGGGGREANRKNGEH